jgi:hypothetical protein
MGYGLQGAFGLDAAQQGLRQRLMDQMLVERHQQELEMQRRRQVLAEQEASQRTDLLKQGQDDRRLNQQGIAEDRQDREAVTAFQMNPAGAQILPRIAGRMRNMGLPVQETPGVAGPAAVQGLQSLDTPMMGPMVTPESTPETFQRGATQADIASAQAIKDRQQAAIDMQGMRASDQAAADERRQEDRIELAKLGASMRPQPAPGTLPPNVQRRIDGKSKAFESLPVVKRTQTAAEAVAFANSLDPNTKNPADDQGIIYAFAKAMDPDSVVREGEYNTVQKYAQSWAQTFGFNASRVFSNTAFLTPEARANMKATIQAKFKAGEQQYKAVRKSYADQINRITGGADGEDFLTDYGSAFPQEAAPSATQSAPTEAAGGLPAVGGMFNGKKVVGVRRLK